MADTVEFELVAPERLLFSAPVSMVVVPGTEGDFGVLPGHTPMISTLRTGVIDVYEGDNVEQQVFVAGGFAEVTAERCTVLADEAVSLDDADRSAAEERLNAAREAVSDAEDDETRASAEREVEIVTALIAAIDNSASA